MKAAHSIINIFLGRPVVYADQRKIANSHIKQTRYCSKLEEETGRRKHLKSLPFTQGYKDR